MHADQPLPQGSASPSFRSVPEMWAWRVGSTPRSSALYERAGTRWKALSWQEADVQVQEIAAGLITLDVERGHRIGILAGSSVAWILVDLAILHAGAATTTLHPSSAAAEKVYILGDAGCNVLFCDTPERALQIHASAAALPQLRHLVVLRGDVDPEGRYLTLDALRAAGRAVLTNEPRAVDDRVAALQPADLATLIYTSGTTGVPKGVELTHDAWIYESEAIDQLGLLSPADKQLLFLPLSHVFAKVMELCFIRLGVPTAVDDHPDRLLASLSETQPTWVAVVPRVLEKAHARILQDAEDAGPVAWHTFRWAVRIGEAVSRMRQDGRTPPAPLMAAWWLADRLVFHRIRAAFGGRLRFFISGGAPLSREIAEFFHAVGVLVLEGYGLTESSAASCVNTPHDVRFGTVGRPLPGTEVRLEGDGEILLRGRGVMRGYWRAPDDTTAAFTPDGWLRTGDIGRILPTGQVEITDRKKEILVTANGKNVAPAHVQQLLAARSPLISQVLLHGDRRPFCSALLTLAEAPTLRWAQAEGIPGRTVAELSARPELRHLLQQAIDDVNRELPSWEQIRRFAVLPEDFTTDNGLLTPSLKPRRKPIEARYAELLDSFYVSREPG